MPCGSAPAWRVISLGAGLSSARELWGMPCGSHDRKERFSFPTKLPDGTRKLENSKTTLLAPKMEFSNQVV